MSLFEKNLEMIGTRSMLRPESAYDYYARSERPSIIAIREHLNVWFDELPEDVKLDVQKWFRSPVGRQHNAAFFEIYLHRLFNQMGFQLRTQMLKECERILTT